MKRKPITTTKLARFMNKNKLTLIEVAREANVSRQQLSRIRRGTADLRIMTAMRIRDACGRLLWRMVCIDELFDKNDPQALRIRAKRVTR
jgi:transcriptional regulator with XRE-family HTH domain